MNPLVEKLIEAAADLTPEEREGFLDRECLNSEIRAEVAALLRYADGAESLFEDAIRGVAVSLRSMREPSQGDAVGSYRILSLIGRGGMGSVYLAERADGEIEQRVAIKLLRADGDRPGWRDRFLNERRLLAALQHPAIVHVIDAGHLEDRRPYLVMEYVEGTPIDRYAAGIDVRERLSLFLKVCEGVSHAHRRLIIHRDLKPSNILVDAAGEPKVLDFGIAKLQNDLPGDTTQAAEQLLTPNYASPEQLRGEAQTTATDIYSLGAVLYKLLAGVSPPEVARGAELALPSRVNPQVPRDMDFVIAKALRPEPEHRYGSVDEFASDVRAVLQRRPVYARGNDTWYRARRYLRRYWVPVTAATLILASLTAGLYIVNVERRVAERRFADVRQLASKLFEIDVQVRQLPGSSKSRQLIVDTALEYLKRVTADVRMQPDLALELGTAYMRVARVQGVNISPNLGQTAQADQTAQKAQALIDSVLAAQPGNQTALLRAGQIAHDRMILAGDGHHEQQALQYATVSLGRLNQFLNAGSLNASSERMEAQQVILALINIANRYMKADDYDQAIRICDRAIEIAHATNWPTQAGAAKIIVALAQREKGELNESLESIHEAIRKLEPPPGEASTGRLQTYGLALIREGQILGEPQAISLNRPSEAVKSLEHALQLGADFARRDASDFQSQYRIFSAETKLADIIRSTEPLRALEMYDDGLRRLASTSANAGTLRNETKTLAASVYPLLSLDRRGEARKRLDAAFDRLKRLNEYPANAIDFDSPAYDTLRAFAQYESKGGNGAHALELCRDLIHLVQATNPKPETSLESAVDMSDLYGATARLARQANRDGLAAEMESLRLDLWLHWDAKLPGNAFVRRQLDAARSARIHHM